MDLSKIKKYEELSFSQWIAIGNKVGGVDVIKNVLQGNLALEVKETASTRTLFDKTGRRIPIGVRARNADRNFKIEKPSDERIRNIQRVYRFCDYLEIGHIISEEYYLSEIERLLDIIKQDHQINNILNGVWLPVVLPSWKRDNDIGKILEQYVNVAGESYLKIFDDRTFKNFRQGTLAGKVSNVTEGRHQWLLERMCNNILVGLHFPNPLQGFSSIATREQMSALVSKRFYLSGIDTAIAMTMYPDILASGMKTPILDLSGLSWGPDSSPLLFLAFDHELNFVASSDTQPASFDDEHCSGSLLFLG